MTYCDPSIHLKAIAHIERMMVERRGSRELHYAARRYEDMAEQPHLDRVWDIIGRVGVCMLTTRFDGGLRARPIESRPDRDAGTIWIVTDLRSEKEYEIEADHDVGLVFIDANANAYLSITARAEMRRDHAKAAEIWKPTDDMWWEGPRDPNVCVLRIPPLTAELWDGPASTAVAAFEFVKTRSPTKSQTSASVAR